MHVSTHLYCTTIQYNIQYCTLHTTSTQTPLLFGRPKKKAFHYQNILPGGKAPPESPAPGPPRPCSSSKPGIRSISLPKPGPYGSNLAPGGTPGGLGGPAPLPGKLFGPSKLPRIPDGPCPPPSPRGSPGASKSSAPSGAAGKIGRFGWPMRSGSSSRSGGYG